MRRVRAIWVDGALHIGAGCVMIVVALTGQSCGASTSPPTLSGAESSAVTGVGGHGGAVGTTSSGLGGAGGMGGCPPFSLSDATGSGVTVGGGGSPPADGGAEVATVCVMQVEALTPCQTTEAIKETLGICYEVVGPPSSPMENPAGSTCYTVAVQPLPCH